MYTKPGHEKVEKECDGLLPLRGVSLPDGKLLRWDGKSGTAQELLQDTLQQVKQAIDEPEGGG